MDKLEQLEVAVILSRGGQLANKINKDWEDEEGNGVDQEDAVALAENFLRLRDILISIRDPEDNKP